MNKKTIIALVMVQIALIYNVTLFIMDSRKSVNDELILLFLAFIHGAIIVRHITEGMTHKDPAETK